MKAQQTLQHGTKPNHSVRFSAGTCAAHSEAGGCFRSRQGSWPSAISSVIPVLLRPTLPGLSCTLSSRDHQALVGESPPLLHGWTHGPVAQSALPEVKSVVWFHVPHTQVPCVLFWVGQCPLLAQLFRATENTPVIGKTFGNLEVTSQELGQRPGLPMACSHVLSGG